MKALKIFLFSLLCMPTYAQLPGDMTQGTLNELVLFDKRTHYRLGDHYFQSEWSNGNLSVVYKNEVKLLKNYPVRFDLGNQEVELKVKNTLNPESKQKTIKVIGAKYLQKFELTNVKTGKTHHFERCFDYKTDTPLTGYFETLFKGKKINLLKRSTTFVQKNEGVKALGLEKGNERILKKIRYYMTINGKTFKIKRRKKFILKQLADKKDQVKTYAKKSKLYFSDINDLQKIFKYYDSL